MRCARPTPPRTTRATVRFGSSLSPPVTSLAAALTAALVAEPASRPAGKQQPCCTSKSPRGRPGAFQGAGSRSDPYAALRLLQKLQKAEARIGAMQQNASLLPPRSQNILTTPEFDRIKASQKK